MAKCKVYPPFSVPLIGLRGSAHLAAMTCIRPGGCAVCQESMRDPFGSALPQERFDPVIGDTLSGVIGDTLIQGFSRL